MTKYDLEGAAPLLIKRQVSLFKLDGIGGMDDQRSIARHFAAGHAEGQLLRENRLAPGNGAINAVAHRVCTNALYTEFHCYDALPRPKTAEFQGDACDPNTMGW